MEQRVVRLQAIPNDSVVLLEGGMVARVDQITFGRGKIRVVDTSHEEHWLPCDAELVLIATPEEALEGFMAMKQQDYGLPPKPKYDIVMPWYEAYGCVRWSVRVLKRLWPCSSSVIHQTVAAIAIVRVSLDGWHVWHPCMGIR